MSKKELERKVEMRVVVAANIILKVEQSHATIDTHTHT